MSVDTYADLVDAQARDQIADVRMCQSAIGSLFHLSRCMRPDIALTVGALASFNAVPSRVHFELMLDVVRNIGLTVERDIKFGCSSMLVRTWCDANFASCLDKRRSTPGWVVVM